MNLVSSFRQIADRRGGELSQVLDANWTPDTAQVNVAGQQVQFVANLERKAAWKLYVELNTRVVTQGLQSQDGVLREALSSYHSVFGITREILKEAGPSIGARQESLGFFAMEILNQVLRPVLEKWHSELRQWEDSRSPDVAAVDHERKWEHAVALRNELERVRQLMVEYCESLALMAGVAAHV